MKLSNHEFLSSWIEIKQANIFSTEEGSIEQHIPGIGKPRKAPVAAIQAIV